MLTTDIALVTDPEYRKYAEEFANDEKAFAQAFAEVWYKLVNRDMGPVSRLVGPDVAPPQPWQYDLPDPPKDLADMDKVEKELTALLDDDSSQLPDFVRLAANSAATFRHTDYLGGTNGARIRFATHWKSNEGLDKAISALEPIKEKFGDGLSWADLIVCAGTVAVKRLGAPADMPFCPGRTDAEDGEGWESLEYINGEPPKDIEDVVDRVALRGLTAKEFVALEGFPKYPTLADLKSMMASRDGGDVTTRAIKYGPTFKHWADEYISAGDEEAYANDFASIWTKVMNVDRFDGPVNNKCLKP